MDLVLSPTVYRMIENLGAKTLVMDLVNHANTEIRMQALLSIQKMMVQNWSVNTQWKNN